LNHRDQIKGAFYRLVVNPLAWTCFVLSLFAIWFCWRGAASRGFEYDELWTLTHYARKASIGEIFTDLGKPNNHPLHTLLVRFAVGPANDSELRTRLPSLLAGLALLAVLLPFFHGGTRDGEVSLLAFAWCISSAPLLHFAQAARGYELQTLLVVTFAFLCTTANHSERTGICLLVTAVVVGLAAILTLSTSVLYLVPIAGCDLANRIFRWRTTGAADLPGLRRKAATALVLHGVWLAIAAVWLWHNAGQLAKSRDTFGVAMASGGNWFSFSADAGNRLFGGAMLVLIACGLLLSKRRGLALGLLVLLLFPLALAPITRGGPARVYLPLVPIGLLAAAIGFGRLIDLLPGFDKSHRRTGLVLVAALVPLLGLPRALAWWTPTDWRVVAPALQRQLPQDAFVNYPSAAGYVIRHYFSPQILRDVSQRVPTGAEFTLVQVDDSAKISAVDPVTGGSMGINVPSGFSLGTEAFAGTTLTYYRARRVEAMDASHSTSDASIHLAAVGRGTAGAVRELSASVYGREPAGGWGVLDALLSEAFVRSGDIEPTVGVLLVSNDPHLTDDGIRTMSAQTEGRIRFYILEKAN
jgi:hypothetical protein